MEASFSCGPEDDLRAPAPDQVLPDRAALLAPFALRAALPCSLAAPAPLSALPASLDAPRSLAELPAPVDLIARPLLCPRRNPPSVRRLHHPYHAAIIMTRMTKEADDEEVNDAQPPDRRTHCYHRSGSQNGALN